MVRGAILAAVLASAACVSPPEPATPADCQLSDADKAWVDRSLAAWRVASAQVANMRPPEPTRVVFFDASCVLSSPNALKAGVPVEQVTWNSVAHAGTIRLPDGGEMPAGVTSFASGDDAVTYFVMSTPSVWRAGGVDGGALSLETLMTAVLLHEASHVAQVGPYASR